MSEKCRHRTSSSDGLISCFETSPLSKTPGISRFFRAGEVALPRFARNTGMRFFEAGWEDANVAHRMRWQAAARVMYRAGCAIAINSKR
jgi:hypothetical protein